MNPHNVILVFIFYERNTQQRIPVIRILFYYFTNRLSSSLATCDIKKLRYLYDLINDHNCIL